MRREKIKKRERIARSPALKRALFHDVTRAIEPKNIENIGTVNIKCSLHESPVDPERQPFILKQGDFDDHVVSAHPVVFIMKCIFIFLYFIL